MKAFLFLEHKFYKSNDRIYTEKVVNYQFIEKYTRVFDELCICARCVEQTPKVYVEPIELSSGISFLGLPDCDSKGLLLNSRKIRKLIAQVVTDTDVAIFRAPSSVSYVTYNAIKHRNIPIAVELVADAEVFFISESNENFLGEILKKAGRRLLVKHAKTLCYNANAVLYVTSMSLQQKYPSYSICNGMSNRYFDVACSDVILLDEYYSNFISTRAMDDEFIICHMGAMFGENKGQAVVIDLVKDLNKRGCKARAIFIGDGISREYFEAYARKHNVEQFVEFVGQLNNFVLIQECFLRSHVFVFPSQNEGLPRSIIEAMANSLPCVAYDVGGISELLDRQLLVEKDDYAELLEKVLSISKDECYRRTVAERNYDKAMEYRDSVLREKRHSFYLHFKNMSEDIRGE